jgi:hypothetical protein
MFARIDIYFRFHLLLIIIYITCISLSLRRTSAPIHLKSVLGVFGTQETSCIIIAWLLERDSFDLLLPQFDKPWVIHLRETCCCSTNLCTWRPNTVYKNRSVRRHQSIIINKVCISKTMYENDFQIYIFYYKDDLKKVWFENPIFLFFYYASKALFLNS